MHQNNSVHPLHPQRKQNARWTYEFQWQPSFPAHTSSHCYSFSIQAMFNHLRENELAALPLQKREVDHFVINTLWQSQLLTKQMKDLSLLPSPATIWAKRLNITTINYMILYIYTHIHTHTHILPTTTRGPMLYRPYNLKHLILLHSIHNLHTPWIHLLRFLSSDNFQVRSLVQPKNVQELTSREEKLGWKLTLFL